MSSRSGNGARWWDGRGRARNLPPESLLKTQQLMAYIKTHTHLYMAMGDDVEATLSAAAWALLRTWECQSRLGNEVKLNLANELVKVVQEIREERAKGML